MPTKGIRFQKILVGKLNPYQTFQLHNSECLDQYSHLLKVQKFFSLNTIPIKEIDMLSIIIIGNSQTTLRDEIFLTPRGYLQN